MGATQTSAPAGERLDSWKEISAYLKRDPRTLQRWEKKEGLPVHRHVHESQVSIYAYPSELDAWLASRTISNGNGAGAVPQPRFPQGRLLWAGLAVSAALLLVLVFVVLRRGAAPAAPVARAFRQVWAGDEVDYWNTVSPDGRYGSFTDPSTGDLSIRDLALGQNRRLTNKGKTAEESPAWAWDATFSPDGKSIAYWWWTDDRSSEVRVVGLDGKGQRTLLKDPGRVSYELKDWSPDGTYIAAAVGRDTGTDLALISPRDGSIRVLKHLGAGGIQRAAFSRDSRYLAYDASVGPDGGGDIFLVSVYGKQDRRIIEYPTNEFMVGWSPRGDDLIFGSDRNGSNGIWRIAFRQGKTQGDPELLKGDIGRISPLTVSRSGSIFSLLDVGLADVFITQLGSKTPPVRISERFVGARIHPSFSTDGSRLLYQADRGPAGAALYIRSLDSGQEVAIHPRLNSFRNPHWDDPSGGVVVSGEDDAAAGTWRVDPQTGSVKLIEAGAPKPLFKPPVGKRGPGEPYPSSDGSTVLQAYRDFPKGYNSLQLIPKKGGGPRELVRLKQPESFASGAFAWSPDGRYVYFPQRVGSATELFRIPTVGGRIESTGLRAPAIKYVSVHPDGKRVAFQDGDQHNVELWALDGFLSR